MTLEAEWLGVLKELKGGHETFSLDFTCEMSLFYCPFIINLVTLENPAKGLGMFVKLSLLVCSL